MVIDEFIDEFKDCVEQPSDEGKIVMCFESGGVNIEREWIIPLNKLNKGNVELFADTVKNLSDVFNEDLVKALFPLLKEVKEEL